MQNSQALEPSYVWLGENDKYETILEFLCARFPKISADSWSQRIIAQKVKFVDGEVVTLNSAYRANCRLAYFREVAVELEIPFVEKILFENEHILVVDKPHFLPVHPAGQYVRQNLVTRLKESQGNAQINPAHRLDRLTAGLVLCSKNSNERGLYQQLFSTCQIHKTYHAVSALPVLDGHEWDISSRIVEGQPWFRMREVESEANSFSYIKLLARAGELALYELQPKTGKKHQLRLHLSQVSAKGILYAPFYPQLSDEAPDDFQKPLQLLAKKLSFIDPITGEKMHFESELKLLPIS